MFQSLVGNVFHITYYCNCEECSESQSLICNVSRVILFILVFGGMRSQSLIGNVSQYTYDSIKEIENVRLNLS